MPLCIFVSLLRNFQQEHAFVDIVEKFLQNQNMLMPARYTYPEILSSPITLRRNWDRLFNDSKFNGEDFINEVSTIGRIHHINVMQLIGYCSEGRRRALVYEYMSNGSLDKYVCPGKGTSPSLTWDKLNVIALGVARGVEYLHRGCDMCILYFDIKPHSILLNHDFTPKVSDFGLAKLYPKEQSLVSVSAARGTMGYIAPELVSRNFGPISYKSDVYSFGMLAPVQVAGAKKNLEAVTGKFSEAYFPDWVYDRLTEERKLEEGVEGKMGQIERTLCIVGLWCIQMNPSDRPSMSRVVEMLEGRTPDLQMPAKPCFPSSQNSFVGGSTFDSFSTELPAYRRSEVPAKWSSSIAAGICTLACANGNYCQSYCSY
ncbi:unnamed protein product [Spirodela intermedia]|uniref:Protein kinase domain-containing protein n=1 Tax=Spirodela intermedia TaxID=51605 RepID=A0A7I8IMC4_SPIIN|nr:unnamed protein product [Spirodela intermedia]CAA6658599.1 unnamed protein product [Spirodela intermedia]